jgi:glycerophosphoryl diester phosphodiesterase
MRWSSTVVIIAHRAYRNGPDPLRENRLPAVIECLRLGWGVEIDIRRAADGRFYISHDPASDTDARDASPFFEAIRRHASAPVALNVKELGYEADLVRYLRTEDVLRRLFLFDMELLERDRGATARRFRAIDPAVRLAARVSDRNEPIEAALGLEVADVVWVDEFDSLWVSEPDVRRLKTRGRAVFAISPEIHGFSHEAMIRRWREFAAWGVDGICTDFPEWLQAEMVRKPA